METGLPCLAPRLSAGEETALGLLCVAGDLEAQRQLVERNLRLVIRIARRFINRGLPLGDLISEGTLGMMRAAAKFQPAKGPFGGYASVWVEQAMRRSLQGWRQIRLPADVIYDLARVGRSQMRLRAWLRREPTEEELLDDSEVSNRVLRLFMQGIPNTVSINAPISGGEDWSMEDVVPSEEAEQKTEVESLVEVYRPYFDELDKRSRHILAMYFGLDGQPRSTLEEVAKTLKISRARVGELKMRALFNLRRKLAHHKDLMVTAREEARSMARDAKAEG
jgi:RNA polymerase sigma factor (sigma-70 family)